jgi:hypothetical protein
MSNSFNTLTAEQLTVIIRSNFRPFITSLAAAFVRFCFRRKQRKQLGFSLPNPAVYRAKLRWNAKRRRMRR